MRQSAANREACPACGGNGFVDVVPERRRPRKPARVRATASAPVTAAVSERPDEKALPGMIAEAFAVTLAGQSDRIRQLVGRAFEEARLAWDQLYHEPPLSELNTIACELGTFADFPIGDHGRSMANVVHDAILIQFTERRAAALLTSLEGRMRVCRLLGMLAGSLQRMGLNATRPLWEMADTLGGAR